MARLRRCDSRCHNAKGSKCHCWCLGIFHGYSGLENRKLLTNGMLKLSDLSGYKQGKVVYVDQLNMEVMDGLVAYRSSNSPRSGRKV